ncbi:PIG-L deacetylase family protein [Dyadobacter sp. NIV53]|uniref:PIG-L deacetylase family protein n=1 Tax=Dyadobacter sp. NIV53 TaxID=2861765 RepID=UPI001E29732F|nr:PIG-L deacetylase family protein [Dyadobacter sp. NIV53]
MGLIQEKEWYADAALLSTEDLKDLGKTLIVAPHPDDESLGCGGTIYLLRQLQIPVHVVFVSDGSMSHPNSKTYPSDKLVALREMEAIEALKILDVNSKAISFLRLKDSKLPTCQMPGFEDAVKLVSDVIKKFETETIFVPWQRDPHPDHRATWQIVDQAVKESQKPVRSLEYFIWLWERAGSSDLPKHGECNVLKVNIQTAKDHKMKAIAAHISQTTDLINDDPDGFTLSPEVLAHFDKTFEIFVEKP